MQHRPLGRSGLSIAPLVLGTNVFGWSADEALSFRLLDAFVDAGLNAIDTADVYSRWVPDHEGGESESIIGRWLAANPAKRDKVQIFTKVGMDMGGDRVGLSARWIKDAVDGSLKRLKTERIDLYQSHQFDPNTPHAETLGAYAELIKAGKVRAIGASNFSAEQLADALDVSARENLPRYESLQPEYNLYNRAAYDGALRDLAMHEKIGVIPYYGLAAGFLTGKYRSEADLAKSAARSARVAPYLNPRGFRILDAVEKVAKARGAQMGEVALAWMIARPGVTAPIASATSLAQMEGLVRAVQLTLTSGDIAELDAASA
ncbi:NADP-dependent aryl-alcohol dehydrogenase [Azorhizobium oxalatiphilum]|uniref:NADP-dependent aryl-alcohol dehydrogenase n=1 Tax=Azorhizobium oxalatiphilum TaxID=980631 RepID=A0A917FFS6_9HYPH|nr:aldo/keto reductase [Azorhizobium oxalatiphilum]GGF77258.1 NADP-dependent aryl-alcohol dehydrogenase [Azorhizobium oxalatiphilum]